MPRPISWLAFIRDLHKSVCNSNRTHYTRRELQQLFKVQPRSAQQILEMLPREAYGGAFIVRREDLEKFLDRVRVADLEGSDKAVAALFAEIRANPPRPSRRTIRMTVDHDGLPTPANALPGYVTLERGRCIIQFDSIEELGLALVGIAARVAADEEAFELNFCRESVRKPVRGRDMLAMADYTAMLQELAEMEERRHTPPHRNITPPTQISSTN